MFLKRVRSSCLHPYRFFNHSTQSYMIQPCGHCFGCSNSRAVANDLLIQAHSSNFRFCCFVTLTFDMKSIPLGTFFDVNDISYLVDYTNNDCIIAEYPLISDDVKENLYTSCQPINGKQFPPNTLPYLDYSLARLFLASLRQRIKQKRFKVFNEDGTYSYKPNKFITDEKITYYLVGEYGTKSLRPHFHILLFFNDPVTLSALRQNVPQIWSYGRTDFQLATGSASSYVASYVSNNALLPQIYRNKHIRPRSKHSIHFGFKSMEVNKEKVQPSTPLFSLSFSFLADGKEKSCLFTNSFINSLYPKTLGFNSTDSRLLLQRYTVIKKALSIYPYASLLKCSSHIYWDICQGSFPQFLVDCGFNPSDFDFRIHGDYALQESSIYRLLLISQKFINLCKILNYSYVDYLSIIIDFYNKKSYLHLKELYTTLEDISVIPSYQDVITDYFRDPDSVYSCNSSYYKTIYNDEVILFNNNIKHKTLNDTINLL